MKRRGGFCGVVCALLLPLGLLANQAKAAPVMWTGLAGSSDWGDSGNWSPEVVPDNNGTHYDVYLDNGSPSSAVVVLSRHRELDSLAISSGDSLTLQSSTGASLTIEDGTLENQGELKLDHAAGSWRALIFTGQSTLRGAGQTTLSASLTNRIDGDGASRLTIQDHKISGSGYLGRDGGGALAITIGTGSEIIAPNTEALNIDPNELFFDGQASLVNRGTIKATTSGRLVLHDGNYDNAGGTIEAAGADAIVGLRARVHITGGTLRSSSGGKIQSWQDGETLAPVLDGLTNEAHVELLSNTDLALQGTIQNKNLIALAADTGPVSHLYIKDDVILQGGGRVALSGAAGHKIHGSGVTPRLVNADNTIQGHGTLGDDSLGPLLIENYGTIEANASGKTLTIDPMGGPHDTAQGMVNEGTLQATGGGKLALTDGFYNNSGGTILAENNSEVILGPYAHIGGGTLDTDTELSTEMYTAGKGDQAPILNNVQVDGRLRVYSDTDLVLRGDITVGSGGEIEMWNFSDKPTRLRIDGDVTLTGDGRVTTDGRTGSQVLGNNNRLTIDLDFLGPSPIGSDDDGPLAVTLKGHLDVIPSGPLEFDPADNPADGLPGWINEGARITLRSETTKLRLKDGTYQSDATSVFELSDVLNNGSTLELDRGAVLIGGKIIATGNSRVRSVYDGTDAPELRDITMDTFVKLAGGNDIGIRGDIRGQGNEGARFELRPDGGKDTEIRVLDGGATLTEGIIQLIGNDHAYLTGDGTHPRLTIGTNSWVGHRGYAGNNQVAFTNDGEIGASFGTDVLIIDPTDTPKDGDHPFINRNLIQATLGKVVLRQALYHNGLGTIRADGTGGAVQLDAGAHIRYGILETTDNGIFQSLCTGTSNLPVLENLILRGTFQLADDRALSLRGTISNEGTIALDGNSANSTNLFLEGVVMLEGAGKVTLFDAPGNAILGGTAADRLVNVGNHIIGAGRIGADGSTTSLAVSNYGVIQSFYGNTALIIDPDDSPSDGLPGFYNAGTLLADGLMGVSVGDGEFQNDGVVSVLPQSGIVFVGTTILNYDDANQRLTGGEWRAKSEPNEAASISMPSGVAITRVNAKVVLDGPHSFFGAIDGLTTVESNGYFGVTGGRVFDTADSLTNGGEVHVGAGSVINVNGVYDDTYGLTSGNGTINAQDALISGTLRPGASVGTLHFNRLTLLDGARIEFEIDSPEADLIHVFGAEADALQFEENATYYIDFVVLGRGDGSRTEFPLIVWDSDLALTRGMFDTLTWDFGRGPSDLLFGTPLVEFRTGPGGGMLVLSNVLLMPEPGTVVHLVLGGLLLGGLALRRRRAGALAR